MAGSLNTDDQEISGINLTPLVDVVLVLLVIFMITAPTIYQNAMNVELPDAKNGKAQSASDHLNVGVNTKGEILIEGKRYTLETLTTFLKAHPPKSAVILADKKVEHGLVIQIIDTLKSNGVEKFSFGIEQN